MREQKKVLEDERKEAEAKSFAFWYNP